MFEDTELFTRTSGDTSEVVTKQMYTFIDKGDRSMTLKPEGTAPVMRSYLEHRLGQPGQVTRLCYVSNPIFRYERPQKGRLRQHHQVGCELVGSSSPLADAEIIEVAVRTCEMLSLRDLVVLINCIGRGETRMRYRDALLSFAAPLLQDMDEETRQKVERNPLRLLDSKAPEVIDHLREAPSILAYLEDSSRIHFDAVQARLVELGIKFEVRPQIVRGLDYYTDTVFEVQSESIGAQSAICGGGRYDNLIKELGGPETPSVGFGMGMERALLLQETLNIESTAPRLDALVIAASEAETRKAREMTTSLRNAGFSATFDLEQKNMKAQFKLADRLGARFAVILGETEVAQKTVTIRDLTSGAQATVPEAEVDRHLRGTIPVQAKDA
jgi:histidyl-tRNA synthetase